jgi:hypothetical protein
MKVPKEVTQAAVNQMVATIHAQRAQFEVQQVTNDHGDDDKSGSDGKTYTQKYAELEAGLDRLREKYPEAF